MDLQTALDTVKNHNGDMTAYRAALEYLVDNRDLLKHRVFIVLPGGLGGNTDPVWDKVKAGTEERCSCGNERVILPSNLRTNYEPGASVTVKPGETVCLRPVGGDRESAYVSFTNDTEAGALTYVLDPYAPLILSADLFSTRGFMLSDLARVAGPEAVLSLVKNKVSTPIARFAAVDLPAKTVTIELDKDIEAFDPDQEKPRHE
jgi:hypothetical protein